MPMKRWGFQGVDAAGIVACVLVLLGFYLAAIGPLLEQRSAAASLRREVQAQQEKVADLQEAKAKVRQHLASVHEGLAASPLRLDSAARINRKVAGLTEFFSGCTLHIDSVQTGEVSRGLQYDVVPITIVGRGGYQQCVRLLHGLCSAFPDMTVIRVELAGNPATPSELEKCRFDLFWYATPVQPAARTTGDGD